MGGTATAVSMPENSALSYQHIQDIVQRAERTVDMNCEAANGARLQGAESEAALGFPVYLILDKQEPPVYKFLK